MFVTTDVTTKLLLRGKTYYLRYRTPKHIQALGFPKEVVKTLKTPDYIGAQQLVLPKLRVMESIYMASDLVVLQSLFEELTDFSRSDMRNPHQSSWEYFDDLTDHLGHCMQHGCAPVDESIYTQLRALTSHGEPLKTQIPKGEGDLYDLLFTLLQAHKENDSHGRTDDFHTLRERAGRLAQINPAKVDDVGSSVTLFESFDEFLADKEKKPMNESTRQGYRRAIFVLKAIVANDIPLIKVKKNDIKEWLSIYGAMPVRHKLPYKNVPIADLIEMDAPDEDLVAGKSVLEHKKVLGGVFKLALNNEYIQTSPVRELGMKFGEDDVTYALLTDEEIQRLQKKAEEDPKVKNQPWRKWVLLLAAFTGARRGELVNLTTEDLKLDKGTGRYFITIIDKGEGTAKSKNAIRRVPVHNDLIEAGLIEYIESLPDGRLFSGLKPSQVTAWFTALKDKVGVPDTDESGLRKVLHSYRHSVITKMAMAQVTDRLMQPVVGHATKKDVTSRYIHLSEADISTFLPAIDAIKYVKT